MSITAQSGILNLLSSQIVSIKKQILDPSTYSETAESIKWTEVEEEIRKELNELLRTFREDVILLINEKTSVIFKYKGNVSTEDDLPGEGNEIGDVYNVEETGANFAWNGTTWDKLSETIDLSIYLTKDDFTNDISFTNGDITSLASRLNMLESRLDELKKSNKEIIIIDVQTSLNDDTKDYILSGNIQNTLAVTGKSVSLEGSAITNNARLNVTAQNDIELKGVSFTGTYDKNDGGGNSITNIHGNDYIALKNCTFNPSNGYNGVEIGLGTGLAKNILIDNVKFEGKFKNNALSIFGTADNAVITISNCYFKDVSNAIRISNRTNTNVTINIINCVCDKWETGDYAGLILCQDYTSGSIEAENTNNLFGNGKVKINIQNLIKPDGTKLATPDDISSICGSGNDQILYVYGDRQGLISYSVEKYPILIIS